ncbi:MAG: undecaprenyldiphospho-muramoylpentapeptide beta-N-acetylglucosaminyltransferase [Sphingomonadales bacterium]|nr:undecaprenyldiphospho-muramoylpentapeptide beta-N-acetylglucosaminyltransferase [Sphingomonadales bacterium]
MTPMDREAPLIMLAAGGTGGHMIPAHALAEELKSRGYRLALITDERGTGYPGVLEGIQHYVIEAGTVTRGGLIARIRGLRRLQAGRKAAKTALEATRPAVVVGFGGYPALPTLMAASKLGIRSCIHEQNAVLGRVNRLLAGSAYLVTTSFEQTARLPDKVRTALTGTPVRRDIRRLAGEPYPVVGTDRLLRILIVGGSQGARILGDVVPAAISLLPRAAQRRLQVTQQCRPEDLDRVRKTYADAGVAAELATYFQDLPERLRWTHLVIVRAGASTLAELTVVGRPAILVPLAIATDDHQAANAEELKRAGGAWVIPEQDFTAAALAKRLQRLANDPKSLEDAAAACAALGRPEAAERLADRVETLMQAAPGMRAVGGAAEAHAQTRAEPRFPDGPLERVTP